MLDRQYEITTETAVKWLESLRTTQALMAAGMTTEAAVSQTEATCYSIETSVKDLGTDHPGDREYACRLYWERHPQDIERGRLEDQSLTPDLAIGIPGTDALEPSGCT